VKYRRAESVVRLNDYGSLQAKVQSLPDAKWKDQPVFILFAVGGFAPEVEALAADPSQRLMLVSGRDLIP